MSGIYLKPMGGNKTNSEAQFQNRVVMTVYRDQQTQNERQAHLGLKDVIRPYKELEGFNDCTKMDLKTNEVIIKAKHRLPAVDNVEGYKDIYDPTVVAVSDDGRPKTFVLSSYNGFYLNPEKGLDVEDFDKLSLDDKEYHCRKNFQLAGIVGTNNDSNGFHNEIGRPDLPAQLGGIYTISNFGHKTILAGDLIVWNCPDLERLPPSVDDTNRLKLVVRTEPYDHRKLFHFNLIEKFAEAVNTYNNNYYQDGKFDLNAYIQACFDPKYIPMLKEILLYDILPVQSFKPSKVFYKYLKTNMLLLKPFEKANLDQAFQTIKDNSNTFIENVKEFFIVLAENRAEYSSRIVGRALTPASPGNEFDIYMGNYCI